MEKLIVIPEWRYEKMLASYEKAMEELAMMKEELQAAKLEGSLKNVDGFYIKEGLEDAVNELTGEDSTM